MKKNFTLILAFLISSIVFGQKITFNHFSSTAENLKRYLLNSGDYISSGNADLPYFQGKEDSKNIKFYKSTGVTVIFDFKTDSEYLSIVHDIQNNAEFRFQFCTDKNESIVYNYETYVGNKIRFNFSEMRISLEFPSELNNFIDENSDLTTVFVCKSDNSYAFHTNLKCSGLANCKSEISKTDIRSAKKSNYKICEICTDDSYSKERISEKYNTVFPNDNENVDSKSNTQISEKEDKNIFDLMGYPIIAFNKNMRSYTVSIRNKKNGIEEKEKMIEPNINNPHYISIASDKDKGGRLTIKNKNYKDIIIDFTKVYQLPYEDGGTPYYFITENKNYSIYYVDNNNSNDFLFIEINQDADNGISIDFGISEI
ncbi:hypothetical protein Aeqsu_2313 [Aequorivita sublithincola DSM 14238]|uniref:Uncharacterized protein n=1 Tax=Aequorivita sublithincola (strain DSM 14238 / LMG 21431 / ACAM 643 / 9-3) TaxID=746697 RepID=I3YXQ5_AEQSU|nr:hypothetical protein [Aequorivita sublithincola]AFL81773.1 hypothetical protein Aeqsu_2313 [Aequorivita sublithincola DSM 14238]